MIDILVPVLSRPENAALLVASIKEATKVRHTILFLCSPGDTAQIEACQQTKAKVKVVPWEAGPSDYPRKMNLGLQITKNKYLLMGADDLTFMPDWDTEVLRVAEETGAGVVGTNDCANRQVMKGHFSTHALVRRSYVEEMGASLEGPGHLVSETYDHNYCDRELCNLAESRGQWAFAPESKIKHRHPLWRTAKWDSTYEKGKKHASVDHENFFLRCAEWGFTGIFPQEKKYLNQAHRRMRRLNRMRQAK